MGGISSPGPNDRERRGGGCNALAFANMLLTAIAALVFRRRPGR